MLQVPIFFISMTNIQEERMYELMGKEGINEQEEHELEQLVDIMCFEFDKEYAEIEM